MPADQTLDTPPPTHSPAKDRSSKAALASGSDKPRRHSGGRPSQADAARRDERLVEIAAAMFMERGFDATTIDAVADAASVGKATVYARYKDKGELFGAVLRRKIDRFLANEERGELPAGTAEDILLNLARRRAAISISPEAVAIHRIVIAQAHRFPALAELVHQEGWQRGNAMVVGILTQLAHRGEIEIDDPELAADLFLGLTTTRQHRLALLGLEIDPVQLDLRLQAGVRLFIQGSRPR